jgi:hypothetical protein
MGALLDKVPLIQYHDAVSYGYCRKTVGNQNGCAILGDLLKAEEKSIL